MGKTFYLRPSSRSDKKFMVTFTADSGREKTIHFGAKGYSDYTVHKDAARMQRYDKRHKDKENWTKSGIETAGFWSKWILWSKPSLSSAISYTANKFSITISRGSTGSTGSTGSSRLRGRSSRSPKRSPRKRSPKKRATRRSTRRSTKKSNHRSTKRSPKKSKRRSTQK